VHHAEVEDISDRPHANRLTIVSRRMGHHSTHSGYDRLADYLGGEVIGAPEDWRLGERVLAKVGKLLIERSGNQWYHRAEFVTELKAMRQWLTRGNHIFHFLYGENSYRYLGALKKLSKENHIVCSYHTPKEKFSAYVREKDFLTHVDALIVVSTVQQEFFSSLVGEDRVFYVPHGVDIDYFRPGNTVDYGERPLECLFVGSHLRDMETLRQVFDMLQKRGGDAHLTVISSQENNARFKHLDNVTVMSGVSEEELLGCYQDADLFLMPLLDCTANNALLEAMACGLPIVTTDLQGVRDYVNGACARLAPKGDAHALLEILQDLMEDGESRRVMADASRRQALNFSWEKVAREIRMIHSRLTEGQ